MKKIGIYYHIWFPVDSKRGTDLITNQLEKIKSSGILEYADFNCVIVGLFAHKITSYIKTKYNFVKVRDVIVNDTIAENHTLKVLYDDAKVDKYDRVLYFHTKGISHYLTSVYCAKNTSDWRVIMDLMLITNWKSCIENLKTYDAYGIFKKEHGKLKDGVVFDFLHYNGNYWWANTDYIKTLPDPVSVSHIPPYKMLSKRHSAEAWIGLKKGNLGCDLYLDSKDNLYDNNLIDLLSGFSEPTPKIQGRDRIVKNKIKLLQKRQKRKRLKKK